MSNVVIHIDDRLFRDAFKDYLWKSKKTTEELLRAQARLFVRDIVRVTPPGHWQALSEDSPQWRPGRTVSLTKASEAKKAGMNSVRRDIAKILTVGPRTSPKTARELHKRYRDKRGRVGKNLRRPGRDNRHRVSAQDLKQELKRSLDNVGILAGGWNAAAQELGVRLPAWITRHGTAKGRISLRFSATDMRITITNAVGFVGNVKDLKRRADWAMMNRARQMNKQLAHYALVKPALASGFRK